jgi:hypothetical protein
LRAVIASGQAAVLHRLAIASKDGEWIVREDEEALAHILGILDARGAQYRFGAPLDERWMSGGWSSHLEFRRDDLRVRTDFFTRPPRVTPAELARLWLEQEDRDPPFTDAVILAKMKMTDRQRDYPFIGELARRMENTRDQLMYSRSADNLLELDRRHPELVRSLASQRAILGRIHDGRRPLAEALQLEMLDLVESHERRLAVFRAAALPWATPWPELTRELEGKPLQQAHELIVARAIELLPQRIET